MSSFKKSDTNYESCIISETDGNVYYNRYVHAGYLEVCKHLDKLHSGYTSLFPSGMCAITTAFHISLMNFKWSPTNIVISHETYCDTPRVVTYINDNYTNVNTFKINVYDNEDVMNTFNHKIDKSKPTILFVETCTNPNGDVFDFRLLKQIVGIVGRDKLRIIVDNTWITSAIFQPLKYYSCIDMVVMSLTKYYGAGRSGIMGAIVCREQDLNKKVFEYGRNCGLHVSPLYCQEMLKNIISLCERIETSSKLTKKVAEYLELRKIKVNYPMLSSHRSQKLAELFFKNIGPSVFTFEVPLKKEEALKWMRSSKFDCTTSFGNGDTRFDQWPRQTKGGTLCRISIGFESSFDEIVEELNRMFLTIKL
jgi:cystathionine beta-lyase/cystathionine gamma-synthase